MALEHVFPLEHPAARGHFPGDPIIPGAVLLSEVLLAIEAELGQPLLPCRVRSVKFLRPVRPGDGVRIEYSGRGAPELHVTCSAAGHPVLAAERWWDAAA